MRARTSRSASRAAFLAALLTAALARAQETPPAPSGVAGQDQPPPPGTGGQAFTDPSQLFSGRAGAFFGLGFGQIGGDIYASTIINTDFSLGPVGLGLALPLNLLLINESDCSKDPHPCSRDDKTYFSVLRKRDWDEPADYLKFIRYVRFGHKRDPIYFQVGQLWGATIGHGTLLDRYANNLSLDHPKTGLVLDVNSTYFGVETLVDSFTNPTLFGGRAYVRPFGGTLIARGLAFGVSLITDRVAPLALQIDPTTGGIATDSTGNILINQSQNFYALGVDVEYELLRNSLISLVPYVDGNRLMGAGNGLHAGVLTTIALPIPILDVGLQARLEYRIMQPGYIPEYFDQTYDLGRFQYAVFGKDASGKPTTTYAPKLVVAQDLHAAGGDNKQGYYGELAFNFAGLLQIGGVLQDYQGDFGTSLGIFATFPKLEIIKLSAYYLRKNFNGLGDAFALDERSLLAASAAYKVFGPLYLRFDFERQWVVQPDSTTIQAVDSYNVGVATYLPF
jgi:hypothetical protein